MTPPAGVAEFLAQHPPFHALSRAELAQLAARATVLVLDSGAVVVDATTPPPDEVWVVRAGQVVLLQADDDGVGSVPVDTVYRGGLFGFTSLLTGEAVQFTARTSGPSTLIRLPGDLVRPVFSRPAGVTYLADALSTGFATARTPSERAPAGRPVGSLVHSDPVIVSAGTSVRDAVRHMTARRSSYALVPLGGGEYGIFTDRDLRSRVVAADLGVDTPIRRVMSAPARCVTEDRLASTVLMEMLEHGLRHIPVLDRRRQVVGVLEDTDLLAASTRKSFVLRRAVALSSTADELRRASSGITDLVVDLFRFGTDVLATSGILSVVVDSVARRALELAVRDGVELPGATFAWLSLGSVARREAMLCSDIDTALSWSDDCADQQAGFVQIAAQVHRTLDDCGLPADRNGAVASAPRFARSRSQWMSAVEGWMQDPLSDRGSMMLSLLLDGRVIWGDHALHTVPLELRRMRHDHPEAVRLLLLEALSSKVRSRSLRDVLSRRGGTFDLKAHAVTPVVNMARWGGLSVGVASGSTPARLRAAAGNGLLTHTDATVLEEVFVLLQRTRMAHHIDQVTQGREPCDTVSMSELTPLNQRLLADGLREITAVQRRVALRLGTGSGVAAPERVRRPDV